MSTSRPTATTSKILSQQFGPDAWGIICRADCRMRTAYMERIRTALEENPAHGYSPASPWPAVSASGIREVEIGGTKSSLVPLCCWPEPSNQPEAWTIRIRIDSSVHLDKGHDWAAHLARAAKGQRQHARGEGVQPNRLNHCPSATYIESPSNCFLPLVGARRRKKDGQSPLNT